MTQNKIQSFKLIVLLFLVVASIGASGFALYKKLSKPITSIHSYSQVDFNAISPHTLVIFDADETLIQPIDTYYINEHTPQGVEFKKKFLMAHPEVKNWDKFADITIKEVQRPLIEPMIIPKIKELQKRGVLVIVCSAINTGRYGSFDRLEEWRYEHLQSLGFQGTFGDLFIDFPAQAGHHPVFYKGILATDTLNKGPIIGQFLDYVHLVPQKVIMFDDSREYLESVYQECKKRNIAFEGYVYQGAKTKPWDEGLIKFQTEYLIAHDVWLNDEQANALRTAKLVPEPVCH